jgi:hypothetical protein
MELLDVEKLKKVENVESRGNADWSLWARMAEEGRKGEAG